MCNHFDTYKTMFIAAVQLKVMTKNEPKLTELCIHKSTYVCTVTLIKVIWLIYVQYIMKKKGNIELQYS